MKIYQGSCNCGSVKFELEDHPAWLSACHCSTCRKRTGSDYGLSVMTDLSNVKEYSGETKTYIRTGDSGNAVQYEFCPNCGTTIRWTVALIPGRVAFAAGTFNDMSWMRVGGEMYTEEAAPWGPLGCENSRPGPPDDDWRIAASSHLRQNLVSNPNDGR